MIMVLVAASSRDCSRLAVIFPALDGGLITRG